MKNLKTILFLSSILVGFSFSEEEEEVRTMEKDGTIYKINNSSLHITPYSEDNDISKASDDIKGAEKLTQGTDDSNEKETCNIDVDISFGTQAAFGDLYTELTNPGTSMGITLHCPKAINLFGQDFTQAYQLSFTSLEGNDAGDDMGFVNIYYVLGSTLDKLKFLNQVPLVFNFYAGISDVETISESNAGIYLSLGSAVNYKLPIEKFDLSLYLSMTQTTNGEDTYGLYSTGLSYGKTLSCSK